jgi:RHS repeat-associated protein
MVKQVVPRYPRLNRLTQFNGAAIQHDLLGNRLQDGRYLYQWDTLNRLVEMQAYQASGRFKVVGDAWRFVYRADGLRVVREKVSQAVAVGGGEAGGSSRTEYLYDGQMPVCEQEFVGSTLRTTRVNFLGARGIEAVVAIDHTRGNAVALRWLLYDGHGNLVRTMAPDYTLSAFQWRGVWGEGQGSLGTWRGYCANLGHPEDETGLVYMRTRYYEPATGRFISEDPSRDGVNWYLYADGNPVNKVDYEGKVPKRVREWLIDFVKAYIVIALAQVGIQLNDLFEWEDSHPFLSAAMDAISGLLDAVGAMQSVLALGRAAERWKDPWKVYSFALYTYVMAWVGTLGMVLMTRSLVELYWLYVEE